jgi:hypothetical protein
MTAEAGFLEEVKSNLNRLKNDQIVNILVKNSNLTEIQLETLLIDFLFENNYIEKANYDLKGLIRSKGVTRGSFHRTLQQARKNITSALFTTLLLIYLGIIDETTFNEFNLIAKRLKEYLVLAETTKSVDSKRTLKVIEEELLRGLKNLLEPKNPSF